MPMNPRLLRPKAAGGFDPRSIANLALWLDAQDSSSLVTTSGQVSQWTDRSGAGRTVNQTTANNRPTLFTSSSDVQTSTAATINGKQALYFDGVNDILNVTPRTMIRNIPGFTLFCVAEFETISGTPGLLYHAGSNQRQSLYLNNNEWAMASRRVGTDALSGQSSSGGAVAAGVPYVIRNTVNYQTAAVFLASNGTQRISATAGWGTGTSADEDMSNVTIGLHSAAGFLKGKIGAMLFYQRVLIASELTAVERYLANRWGVALA